MYTVTCSTHGSLLCRYLVQTMLTKRVNKGNNVSYMYLIYRAKFAVRQILTVLPVWHVFAEPTKSIFVLLFL